MGSGGFIYEEHTSVLFIFETTQPGMQSVCVRLSLHVCTCLCVCVSVCQHACVSACVSVCVCKYMSVSLSFATPSWVTLDFSLVRSACGTFVCETQRHIDIHTHRCVRPSRYVVQVVLSACETHKRTDIHTHRREHHPWYLVWYVVPLGT